MAVEVTSAVGSTATDSRDEQASSAESGVQEDDLELGDPVGVACDVEGDDPLGLDAELDHASRHATGGPHEGRDAVDQRQATRLGAVGSGVVPW